MVRWLGILFGTLRSSVRTHRELALENLALRQQLAVWKARQPRPRLTEMDRIFWVLLSRLWTSWRDSVHVVRPETVVGWHRHGFRCYWAWKSRHRRGRPRLGTELRDLIRRMSRANPLWGAPRIHGELLKLGLTVSQTTVSKYMVRPRRPPSQAWRTFSLLKLVCRNDLALCEVIGYLAGHGQMAWDPSSDIPVRGSHAPRVGAGESRAAAATRRVESASATAAADGDGPDLLDRGGETLEELAEFLAGGAARDRGAVAPPGLQALLGMEESTPMGSARDWEGPAGSDTADEPRESAVGCAEDPRRAVEARADGLAGDGVEVHSPAS